MRLIQGARLFVLGLFAVASLGLAESFDSFDFQPPKGWARSEFAGGIALTQKTEGSFASIVLYSSVPAGGDARQNFLGEWKRLVTDGLALAGEPSIDVGQSVGGYSNMVGGITASQDGIDFLVLLSTFTGNGRVASVLYLTTDSALLDTFDAFNSALKLSKPKAAAALPAAPAASAGPGGQRPIGTPTTKFNDGWVATVEAGLVRVAKGSLTVLLHDPLPLPESMWVTGNERERVAYYWDRLVAPRYRVDELKVFKNDACYTCLYFGEGNVTEVATGARKYVALYLNFNGSNGSAVQVVAPDFASYQRQFPNIEAVGLMPGYNKFAVKKTDLTGSWTDSYSGSTQYYNAATGAFYGTNAISTNDQFTFNADGSYSSKHVGATGFIGSQTFSQTAYKGTATVTDWQVRLSGRWKGETEAYDAFFEVVGGRPILHLVRVGSAALNYVLIPMGR